MLILIVTLYFPESTPHYGSFIIEEDKIYKFWSADRRISTTDNSGPVVLHHGGRHHVRMLSIRQQDL